MSQSQVAEAQAERDRVFSSFFLSSSVERPPLRIGLLLDDGPSPLKKASAGVVQDIVRADFTTIELVVVNAADGSTPQTGTRRSLISRLADPQQRAGIALALYSRFDQRRYRVPDPRGDADATQLLAGIPILRVHPITRGAVQRFPPEALEAVRSADLDVIIRFGFNILRGEILDAGRYGVWSFHHGDSDRYRGGPACFWEMVEHSPTSGVILQRLTEELDAGQVLAKGQFATDPVSLLRNRSRVYFGSSHLMIQKLRELHAEGWKAVADRAPEPRPYMGRRRIYRSPSNGELLRWFTPVLGREAVRRGGKILRLRDQVEHWRVAVRVGGPGISLDGTTDMSGFRWIELPRGHLYADPFLMAREGRTWLFFEDYRYAERKGVISCAELRADGTLAEPTTVLSTAGHLSYPYLIADGESTYMIPESNAERSIKLYRATRFPYDWEPVAELYSGAAVDTSAWNDGERWWFFATLREPLGGAEMLMLFHSRALEGPWVPHPRNPISLDVRTVRGAGSIYREQGRLLRPTQDGSRDYGYSFTLNEIVTLTPDDYRERPLTTIEPDWAPGLLGTHTYNRVGSVEVIDGKVWRPRSTVA